MLYVYPDHLFDDPHPPETGITVMRYADVDILVTTLRDIASGEIGINLAVKYAKKALTAFDGGEKLG